MTKSWINQRPQRSKKHGFVLYKLFQSYGSSVCEGGVRLAEKATDLSRPLFVDPTRDVEAHWNGMSVQCKKEKSGAQFTSFYTIRWPNQISFNVKRASRAVERSRGTGFGGTRLCRQTIVLKTTTHLRCLSQELGSFQLHAPNASKQVLKLIEKGLRIHHNI